VKQHQRDSAALELEYASLVAGERQTMLEERLDHS
jgi:hypothetical protein